MRKPFLNASGIVLAAAVLAGGPGRARAELIVNGDFEDGGGSLAGWTVMNQGLFGDWFVQSGTTSPESGFDVPAPPGPTHAAMTDQMGFGSHVLYQDFVVPIGILAATFQFDLFIGNRAEAFFTPETLDPSDEPNQQARVDIITTTADPFSVSTGDVLFELYRTTVGDPLVSGYTTQSVDLGAFLAAREGQSLRLRFAEADNQDLFQFGIDQVRLDVELIPEPSTLTLFVLGAVVLIGGGWCRRNRVA